MAHGFLGAKNKQIILFGFLMGPWHDDHQSYELENAALFNFYSRSKQTAAAAGALFFAPFHV